MEAWLQCTTSIDYLSLAKLNYLFLCSGLTQNNSGAPSDPPKQSAPPARRRPSEDQHTPSAPKRPRPLPPRPPPPAPPQQVEDDDEIQEFVPVKSEPVAAQQQEVYEQAGAPGGEGEVDGWKVGWWDGGLEYDTNP